MTDRELLGEVIQSATFAADAAALGGQHATQAQQVAAAVRAAFEMALGNGLISITPRDQWPEWQALDPPYDPTSPWTPEEART